MKFSYLILTWNRRAFLERCISELVANIGASDSEIIVMDNGSDDGTPEYLNELKSDQRFRIYLLKKNYGLASYKKLLRKARGEFIVIVDDDVLMFPPDIEGTFASYFSDFPDFGFLALDVIQNEHTNGAKPPDDHYVECVNGEKVIQAGPAGGWCACFKRKSFRKVWLFFELSNISMKAPEDGLLSGLIYRWCGLKSGIIKGKRCFHASGPHYSRENGFLDRDIEKYRMSGLADFVDAYRSYK